MTTDTPLERAFAPVWDAAGNLTNWSGCGNDLRATAAMSCIASMLLATAAPPCSARRFVSWASRVASFDR